MSRIEAKEKRCCDCGLIKPADAFHKDKKRTDGLKGHCKECQSKTNKQYYTARIKPGLQLQYNAAPGIESWTQIESVIRELSELQAAVEDECEAREKRIALIVKYSNELTEPASSRKIFLEKALIEFLSKQPQQKEGINKKYRFGEFRYRRKTLVVSLDADLARMMKDKP